MLAIRVRVTTRDWLDVCPRRRPRRRVTPVDLPDPVGQGHRDSSAMERRSGSPKGSTIRITPPGDTRGSDRRVRPVVRPAFGESEERAAFGRRRARQPQSPVGSVTASSGLSLYPHSYPQAGRSPPELAGAHRNNRTQPEPAGRLPRFRYAVPPLRRDADSCSNPADFGSVGRTRAPLSAPLCRGIDRAGLSDALRRAQGVAYGQTPHLGVVVVRPGQPSAPSPDRTQLRSGAERRLGRTGEVQVRLSLPAVWLESAAPDLVVVAPSIISSATARNRILTNDRAARDRVVSPGSSGFTHRSR
jgi:hypothetical protein